MIYFAAISSDPLVNAIVGMIAYVAPFFLIPATFKAGSSIFHSLAGGIQNRGGGFFANQKKRRQETRAATRQRGLAGTRFRPDSLLGRTVNRGFQTASIVGSGRAGLNPLRARGRADAFRSGAASSEMAELMDKNAAIKTVMNDDTLARATQLGRNEAEISRILESSGRYRRGSAEMSQAVSAVEAAQRAGSTNAVRGAMAIARANSGTGYDTASDMQESILQAAGGDRALEGAILAASRSGSEKARRFDLSGPGHTDHTAGMDRMRNAMGTPAEAATRAHNNRVARQRAFETQGAGAILGGRDGSVQEITTAIASEYNQAVATGDADTAMELAGQMVAIRSAMGSAPTEAKRHATAMFAAAGVDMDAAEPVFDTRTGAAVLDIDPGTGAPVPRMQTISVEKQLARSLEASTHAPPVGSTASAVAQNRVRIAGELRNRAGAFEGMSDPRT